MSEKNNKNIYGGRYEVTNNDWVGHGSFSWVVKAFDHKLKRTVCLKIALPLEGLPYLDRVRLFRTEAELGASLFHPNIVRVLDFCFMGKDLIRDETEFLFDVHCEPIIVMDYIEGVQLWDFTQKNELSISRVVDISSQITKALIYTHNLPVPIVHRDIRESNILINKEGHIFVTDWGVSKKGNLLTTHQVAKGTYGYMSPEIMDIKFATKPSKAFVPIDGRADLFSLGVLMYKLVTRKLPFSNLDNIVQLREDIRNQQFEAPSQLNPLCPAILEKIILNLLKENPDHRIQTATALLEELKKLSTEVGPVPMHDCQTIVPDVLRSKDLIDQPLRSIDQETTTYFSDAPQEIAPRLNPKLRYIGVAVAALVGIIFFYQMGGSSNQATAIQTKPEIKVAQAAPNPEVSKPTTPDQLEKLIVRKQRMSEPSNIKRLSANNSVEKLGSDLVVYSKDNPESGSGYAMMKNYGVKVGSTFDALIIHEIETSNISSPVRAILTKDIFVKGKVIFPKGTKLLGGAIGDQNERIQVRFDRMILPDNREVEFDGSALDVGGSLGIKGKVDREKTKRMNAGAGRVMAGAASAALDSFTGGVGTQAATGAGQEAVDLTANEVDFKNQAATVVRLEKNIDVKVYINRSF